MRHVFPIKDTEPHFFLGTCPCAPIEHDGMIVHNAYTECGSQWTKQEITETMRTEYVSGTVTLRQHIDVDGRLVEEFL